jgi:(S)-mandelate dehydrogenase
VGKVRYSLRMRTTPIRRKRQEGLASCNQVQHERISDYQEAARAHLPRFVFDYVDGGADDEICLSRNRRDLDAITLSPRVLRDTRRIDTNTEVFGVTWRYPFGVAPTGLNGLLWPRGDIALAAAAAAAGIPFTLSTAATSPLELIRQAAPAGNLWLQLYVLEERELCVRLARRAEDAGFRALVLTVDVPVSGYRTRDVQNGFVLPMRMSANLALDFLRHPRWMCKQLRSGTPTLANIADEKNADLSSRVGRAMLARKMDRSLTWRSLDWVRSIWHGPIVVKGILREDDALRAIDSGVDGIVVSNHGGRQFDASPSAISVLPRIANVVQSRIPVLMDGGVRSGTDIVRALALGARAVLVGRPLLYGLACSGQLGVEAVISILTGELERAMALLGAASLHELSKCRVDASVCSAGPA